MLGRRVVWPEGLAERRGSCGRKSWSVEGRQGAWEVWSPIHTACWLDWSMREIGCLGKYVDILDSSHLETTEDTESYYLSSTRSLLTSITRGSFLYSMQMLFHPLIFAFSRTVFHEGDKWEWGIYPEGTLWNMLIIQKCMHIIVSFIEYIKCLLPESSIISCQSEC